LVVRATSKKSNDDSSSPGDASQENKPSNGNKSGDSAAPKSFGLNTDWREFRANLFMKEQVISLALLLKNYIYILNKVYALNDVTGRKGGS
jgi:hypothetical protein